jgi:tetratricopeptide (TPR) repeat protein
MLQLPGVTLVCIDTANHALALRAIARSCAGVQFARALLLTDALPDGVAAQDGVEVVAIAPITSRDAYSNYVLKDLLPHVNTDHVLLVQWDGYVVNPGAWDAAFLDCDYLGAQWFWHSDGMRVGNGGFSLRSRRLLAALQDPRITLVDAEDTTIGRTFRPLLEREHSIRFGSEALADRFAFEAAYPIGKPFGFHGLFNFWQVMPPTELAALAAQFSDGIARSEQLTHLLNNCMTAGQWAPAIAIARRMLQADPSRTSISALLAQAEGNAARGLGVGRNDPCPCGSGKRYKQCHGAVGTTVKTEPVAALSPDGFVARGMQAHQRGELESAEQDYRAALATAPDHPVALHFLGVIHYQRNRIGDALPLLLRAVALRPDEPEFHNNLGLTLAAADRTAEAVAQFRQALKLKPDLSTAWNNLGLALTAANEPQQAVAAFRDALRVNPDFAQAHWNLSLALLLAGEYAEGWREYEWRHRDQTFGAAAASAAPRWQGEDLAGRTLLLSTEQGMGDAVQFVRFAAPLAQAGARVILRAPDVQAPLLATAPGVAAVVRSADSLPRHDFQLPLLSVAGVLGIDATNIPPAVPYLSASRDDTATLAAEMEVPAGTLRVGLSWAGNARQGNDRRRSCPLAELVPLLELPGIAWYSLQKGDGEDQVAQVPAAARIRNLDARNDFLRKAALIEELDLVISVCTSNAHLAGALGKPVWVMLQFAADWRWGLDRTDSLWYPTARLFRQPRPGDWASVVAQVRSALSTLR